MAGKIIDEDVLKLTVQNLTQLIADHVFEEEEYTPEQVESLFDCTPEQLQFYESIINPNIVSENRLWSSKTISDKLQQLQLDCNSYADEIATRNLTTEIVTATSEVTKENVLYLILSDSSTNTYEQYMFIGGTATPLGSTKIDLSDVYTKSEIDTKLDTKANSSEVLAVDKIQTTTGSETNDTVYSSKLTKTELDKKANDSEVVKKTDISTSISSTSTNDKVAGAKAVYDSLINKLDKTVILTTANEVNSFDREYQSFIIEPSVAEAVGLPKAPDSTWFCINLSHVKGFKYPSQIAFEYAGIERIMYRTAHNGVWHDWKKLCITSVADVPKTSLAWADTTYFENSFTGCHYQVKNGVCFVNIDMICNSPMTGGYKLPITLPTPNTDYVHSDISSLPNATYEHSSIIMAVCFGGTHVIAYGGIAGDRYLGTFSYPVAE